MSGLIASNIGVYINVVTVSQPYHSEGRLGILPLDYTAGFRKAEPEGSLLSLFPTEPYGNMYSHMQETEMGPDYPATHNGFRAFCSRLSDRIWPRGRWRLGF
jgi:hypothetical protein